MLIGKNLVDMNNKDLSNHLYKTVRKHLPKDIYLVNRGPDANQCLPDPKASTLVWEPTTGTNIPSYLLPSSSLGLFSHPTVAPINYLCTLSLSSAVSSASHTQCAFEKSKAAATKFRCRQAIYFMKVPSQYLYN